MPANIPPPPVPAVAAEPPSVLFISAEITVRSHRADYLSLFDSQVDLEDLKKCRSDPETMKQAVRKLKELGFSVTSIGRCSVCFFGLRRAFETSFSLELSLPGVQDTAEGIGVRAVSVPVPVPRPPPVSTLAITDAGLGKIFAHLAFHPSALAGNASTRAQNTSPEKLDTDIYLDELPKCLRKPHDTPEDGTGVNVTVVDTGCYDKHDFFKNNNSHIINSSFILTNPQLAAASSHSMWWTGVSIAYDNLSDTIQETGKTSIFSGDGFKEREAEVVAAITDGLKTISQASNYFSYHEIKEFLAKNYNLNNLFNVIEKRQRYDDICKSICALAARQAKGWRRWVPNESQINSLDHGTEVCANVLALAPQASLFAWKSGSIEGSMVATGDQKSDMQLAIQTSKREPAIVNCSFGTAFALNKTDPSGTIKSWVDLLNWHRDTLFVFGAGNVNEKNHLNVEPHLAAWNVLAVGGAWWKGVPAIFPQDDNNIELRVSELNASNMGQGHPRIAKGQDNSQIELRSIPDVCGMVANEDLTGNNEELGMLWCPTAPGLMDDQNQSPWARLAGTSYSAPQISGICALIKQAWPGASPQCMKTILIETATPVKEGRAYNAAVGAANHQLWDGQEANAGLAHVGHALVLARLIRKCWHLRPRLLSAKSPAADAIDLLKAKTVPQVGTGAEKSDDLVIGNGGRRIRRKEAIAALK